MTIKKSATKTLAKKVDSNAYKVLDGVNGFNKDMTTSQLLALVASDATYTSAITLKQFSGGGDRLEVTDLIDEMRNAGNGVVGGDLSRVERMLTNQALSLDAIFNNLAQRAGKAEYMKGMEVYFRLALKAQAQARATAEALALLKYPQPYIKQANISNGPQQVNNGAKPDKYAPAHSQAGKTEVVQNKLLEACDGERLDIGAQGAAGRINQAVETVEPVHRANQR
jgi:hypothetical protein